MRPTTLLPLPLLLPLLPLIPPTAADCSNTYNNHPCPGSIYGVPNAKNSTDISGLICCKDSSSCSIQVDGSITKCDSGTQVALSQAQNSGAVSLAAGSWVVVMGALAAALVGV
jgi:hypothetical protein